MRIDLRPIKPGFGLGILKFGISRNETKQNIGEPTCIEKDSYQKSEIDLTETWHYEELGISIGFDEEDNWKLKLISVTSDYYELENRKLIGLRKQELGAVLEAMKINDGKYEDFSSQGIDEHELISSCSLGMNFWFDGQVLIEIQMGPLFLDKNTFEWPE